MVEDATDEELRAVCGPRAEYYLAQWRGTAQRGTNWPSFLFSGLWLPYRRMYRITLLFYLAVAVASVIEESLFAWLGFVAVPRAVELGSQVGFAIVCGTWANRWYLAHARRVIAATRTLALEPEAHLEALRKRGGTRALHAVAVPLLCFVILVTGGAALAMLTGQ